jgi:glutamate:GABA antiporter
MQSDSKSDAPPKLRPALSVFDLVLLNVATIVGLRWLSTAAQIGPSGLTLWVIAALVFFIPSGLAVQELSSRIPHVGGLYLWTRAAFGDTHAFLAAWAYTLSNLVFLPSLLLFISGILLHVGGGSWLSLADNPVYNGVVCLGLLWAATFVNILGLRHAKWVQNVGGISTLVIAVMVLGGGVIIWLRYGPATPVSLPRLVPDMTSLPTLSTFAILVLGYVGLELGPIMGDEINDAAHAVRRATIIAGIAIAAIYMAGTAALLVALPANQISAISGIPEALEAVGQRAGVLHIGALVAILLAVANVGGLSAWIAGVARLPFVMGLGHYLPESLGALHPKYRTPNVALWVQAALASLVLLLAVAGSAVREAYQLLVDLTAALDCLAWAYIFASLAVLRRRAAGDNAGVALIPGGPIVCWVLAGVGVLAMIFATFASMVPPQGSGSPALFILKGVGGLVLVFVSGMVIVRRGLRRRLNASGAALGVSTPDVGDRLLQTGELVHTADVDHVPPD